LSKPIERVVVALDATAETRTAIDVAVRLAAGAGKPLHAVFVEDEDLLSLAGLKVAREIVAGGGTGPLTADQLELQLRAAAVRARQDILVAAQIHALEYSFEVVRGSAETALSAASERDLVVAGALARPVAGHLRVDSRWLAAYELAPGPILLARKGAKRAGGTVVLLRERTMAAGRLLQAAARIAESDGGTLTVICPSALAAAEGFAEWVDEQIAPSATRPRIEPASGEAAELDARIAQLGCGLVAVGAGTAEGDPNKLRELSERFDCDLLVVR
jgi:nucleotide-binding universal stress UspA family protein